MNNEDVNDAERKLITLIRQRVRPDEHITLDTVIQTDLGIDGDDGYKLIDDVHSHFGTDFSSFDDRYFSDELWMSFGFAAWVVAPLAWALMWITKKGAKVDLKVRDILDAVVVGHWTHPNRSAKYPWQRLRKDSVE